MREEGKGAKEIDSVGQRDYSWTPVKEKFAEVKTPVVLKSKSSAMTELCGLGIFQLLRCEKHHQIEEDQGKFLMERLKQLGVICTLLKLPQSHH